MSLPDTGKNGGIKTIAFRFKPDLHAQLTLIAQLRGHSLQDEVVIALTRHVADAKADPELRQRVADAQAAIEQEAQERRATIDSLFDGSTGSKTPDKAAPHKAPAKPPTAGKPGGRTSSAT